MMNKYLVTYRIEGKTCEPVIKTATEIFSTMGMDDCYDISIIDLRLLWVDENSPYVHYPVCKFFRTWHNGKDPLRMEIRSAGLGVVYDVGYAPDH